MSLAARLAADQISVAGLPSSYHYIVGPLVAFGVVIALGFLSRWWMAPSRPQKRRREQARARRDFGLLVPVAVESMRSDAERLAAVLTTAGIRATVVIEPPGPTLVTANGYVRRQPGGRHQVMVFGKDERRARALLEEQD